MDQNLPPPESSEIVNGRRIEELNTQPGSQEENNRNNQEPVEESEKDDEDSDDEDFVISNDQVNQIERSDVGEESESEEKEEYVQPQYHQMTRAVEELPELPDEEENFDFEGLYSQENRQEEEFSEAANDLREFYKKINDPTNKTPEDLENLPCSRCKRIGCSSFCSYWEEEG